MNWIKENLIIIFLLIMGALFVIIAGLLVFIIVRPLPVSNPVAVDSANTSLTTVKAPEAVVESAALTATVVDKPVQSVSMPTATAKVKAKIKAKETAKTTATAIPIQPSTPIPANLKFGYTDRGMNCLFITEIVTLVLEQEFDFQLERKPYETPDALFTALAEGEVGITLCYIDPVDRPRMKEKLGDIRQIGSYYWRDDEHKLQVWTNTRAKSYLRDYPCFLGFFENLKFTETEFQEQNALDWILKHPDDVDNWMKRCPQ